MPFKPIVLAKSEEDLRNHRLLTDPSPGLPRPYFELPRQMGLGGEEESVV